MSTPAIYLYDGTAYIPALTASTNVATTVSITAPDIVLNATSNDVVLGAADDVVLTASGDVSLLAAEDVTLSAAQDITLAAIDDVKLSATTGDVTISANTTSGSGITMNANTGGLTVNAGAVGPGSGGIKLNVTGSGGAATVNASSFVVNGIGHLINASANMVLQAAGAFPSAIKLEAPSGGIELEGRVTASLATSTTGAGAVPVQSRIHRITTTGAGNALTLANGAAGQYLDLIYVAESAGTDTAVLTPTTLAGGTTITFNAVGDTASLVYDATGGWYKLGGSAVLA